MRKLVLSVIALFILTAGFAQSNISNGDLENWYTVPVSGTLEYMQPGTGPADNYLTSLNELASIPPPIGPGPVTVFRTDDAHSGTYAAKLVSANFPLIPSDVFIPGMIGTCQMMMTENRAKLGRQCEGCRPVKFTGWYKSMPVGGDSTTAVALVSKWNAETKHRDTIGFGSAVFHGTVDTYTQFEVILHYTYPASSLASDSLTLLCVSSGGFSAVNFMGGVGEIGSTMYVDELMLEYPAGIQQSLMPEVTVKTWPNPATEVLNVELSREVKGGVIEVMQADGKIAGSFTVTGLRASLPVQSLVNGTYYYRLLEGKSVFSTGSFIIRK
jgi:hypothetical protein